MSVPVVLQTGSVALVCRGKSTRESLSRVMTRHEEKTVMTIQGIGMKFKPLEITSFGR